MIVSPTPAASGTVLRAGQRIAWQEFGAGDDVVLLLPTWTIVHTDFWRHEGRTWSSARRSWSPTNGTSRS